MRLRLGLSFIFRTRLFWYSLLNATFNRGRRGIRCFLLFRRKASNGNLSHPIRPYMSSKPLVCTAFSLLCTVQTLPLTSACISCCGFSCSCCEAWSPSFSCTSSFGSTTAGAASVAATVAIALVQIYAFAQFPTTSYSLVYNGQG